MKNLKKGFTLIELLVVIAIIGILAAMVLVSLSSARNKAKDARIQAALSSYRSGAEMYFADHNNSYSGVCTATGAGDYGLGNLRADIASQGGGPAGNCTDAAGQWSYFSKLSSTATAGGPPAFCVDSSGVAKSYTTVQTLPTGGSACP